LGLMFDPENRFVPDLGGLARPNLSIGSFCRQGRAARRYGGPAFRRAGGTKRNRGARARPGK